MEYITPTVIIQGLFGAGILAFVWRISVDNNNKTDNVFKRFDQHKDDADKRFVRKDVCQILHEQMKKDIAEIKQDVKLLIKMVNHG